MKMKRTFRGFTLPELLVAMILFAMVLSASCVAILSTMNLMFKESEQAQSSTYAVRACDFITKKINYGVNIEIVSAANLRAEAGYYDKYFDSDGDFAFFIGKNTDNGGAEERVIMEVTGVSNGFASTSELYITSEKISEDKKILNDMILKCTPDTARQTVLLELEVKTRNDDGTTTNLFSKKSTARKLNTHIGSFKADFDYGKDQNYYIFIDSDTP